MDRLYQFKFIASKAPNSILLDTATRINLLARSLLRFAWAGVLSILLPLSLYVADLFITVSLELLGLKALEMLTLSLVSAALLPGWALLTLQLCLVALIVTACCILGVGAVFYIVGFAEAIWRLLRLE